MALDLKMRRFSLLCLIAGLVVESGCGKELTRPVVTDLRFAVTAAPDVSGPSTPITLRSRVTNAGNTRVLHCSGCGCGNGIWIVILGPDGKEVALHDPNAPQPGCQDRMDEPLEPAMILEGGDRFTGVLYQRGIPTYPSPTYAAPSGTYTVISTFAYQPPSGQWVELARRTTFVWLP